MTPSLGLRSRVPGAASAEVRQIGGRAVTEVHVDADNKRGALSQDDGETIAEAARLARHEGTPLVVYLASSGADIGEGFSALVGWGRGGAGGDAAARGSCRSSWW